ncbi:thiol-disulfide oxidoreductase DCC family protein [Antrihabitans sp. YC2-6]|uniref:thiol-disulfide oxidoreductase DCC family protein n=1 Tax=Antrihabitans sp. YC2-6 TaxID=2799498 RepID=UPI0018F48CDC|nr:DUF393 domain-containing protein [Antrihabitans sp. YC2-6]MBJ8344174.1 DUF393 domain-containing protein [Antrihabitans sp. YC2-6]
MPDVRNRDAVAELLYDRDCGFCVKSANFLARIDRRGRVNMTALQEKGAPERFGLTLDQALEQVWATDSHGTRYGGAGAVNLVFGAALGTRIPLYIYKIPGIRWVQDAVYRWVAANRYRLPGKGGTCAVELPQ